MKTRRVLFYAIISSIVLIASCSSTETKIEQPSIIERMESILVVNDTDSEIHIIYNNITIASNEDLLVEPGSNASINLKDVWSTSSWSTVVRNLREYVVLRLLERSSPESGLVTGMKGDEALAVISENLERENNEWIVRMSAVFR